MHEEAVQQIAKQFSVELEVCGRIQAWAESVFSDPWPGRLPKTTADGLIAGVFSRSFDTFVSSITLSSQGRATQAQMLNRSLFEDMVDAHWIGAHPDKAEERYQDHDLHGRMLLADAVAKYPNVFDSVELPEFDPAERKRLDGIYTRWGVKPWTLLNLHERVGLIEDQWKDEPEREFLHFFHDIAHRENNQTLHVSAQSLNATVHAVTDDGLTFIWGERVTGVDRAVMEAFWTFAQTCGLLIDHFGLPMDEAARQELFSIHRFRRLDAATLRQVGRNQLCPCGSGRKYKKCHLPLQEARR